MDQTEEKPPPLSQKDRLRSVRLPADVASSEGVDRVVDVKHLNSASSKIFLDRVLTQHDAHDDQSILLDKVRQRLEAAGLQPPSVEVRYENLSVQVDTIVTSRHVPSLINPFGGSLFSKADQARRAQLTLLNPCSGILRPGKFTLVLGPPGSGRSTFLRALTGRAQIQNDLKISGSVTYNGRALTEFEPAHAAAYVSQADLHYGELTVRETLEFAAKCFGSKPLRDMLEVLHDKEDALGITPDPSVDAFMKASAWGGSNTVDVERTIRLLGLEKCSDTVVGNAMLRGVSGGEKKRVTSGEVLVGSARVFLGDEVSTGLDSRTTYDVVKYLLGWVKALNGTAALALLQPTPETFELFDDVILLSAGVVVYNGPREGVLPFFSALGFECPSRCGVAEFMQEVTTPTDQQKYWSFPGNRDYQYVPAATMAAAFAKTEAAKASRDALAIPYEPPLGDDRLATIPLPKSKYGASYGTMWMANAVRAAKMQSRFRLFLYVRWFQVTLMALVTGTLYIKVRSKTSVDDGNLILGACFFSMVFALMAGASEMHLLTERLYVFFRQREMNMYPGSAFALPTFLWRIPYCLIDAIVWSCIMYFATGLDASASRFFMFVFLFWLTAIWSTSLHQAIASVIHETIALAVSMLVLMVLIVAGGYVVIKSAIPGAWKAAYYSNPWFYLTQAFAINEFTGQSWAAPYNATNPDSPTLGVAVLEFRDFQTEYKWVWYGIAITFASTVINVAVFVLAATYRPAPRRKGFITEDGLLELECNREAAKPVPPSMKQDIEMGMRRSASMKKLTAEKGSQMDLASMVNGKVHNNGNLNALANGGDHKGGGGGSPTVSTPTELSGRDVDSPSSALPFVPMRLTFQDVSYSVTLPKDTSSEDTRVAKEGPHAGQLQLLHNITGSFRPGVLTALMGASGAGKTTLMDVLAGRKTGGLTTGDVRVNGHVKDDQTFARVSAYVEQEDSHMAQCTVAEALEFSAALRLPSDVTAETRREFINEVMGVVELRRMGNNIVGHVGEGVGLTIEQRKRLTIAVELVSNPSILFMDEPTTGLDARGAAVVMSTVRATAATGRTVVCTIHQPSYSIFEAFDELLVLKPGGRCIYNGQLGVEAADLISYFSAFPGVEPMKPQLNPANWMLEQTAPRRETELGLDFAEQFNASPLAEEAAVVAAAAAIPAAGSKPLVFADLKMASLPTQSWLIMSRLFLTYWRMPKYILVRMFVAILVAAVFGSIFFDQGQAYITDPSPATVLNIAGVCFLSVLFVGATNAMTIQIIIAEQRKVFYRERAAGMYKEVPFAVAQGLVEIPYLIFQSIIYVFPVYFMIGFGTTASQIGYFFLYFLLTLWYFTEFGAACVNLTPELGIATLLVSFLFSFFNLFSGFLIPMTSMGWWWRWFVYLNPVFWSLYSMLTSQLGNVQTVINNFDGSQITVANFMVERFGYSYSMLGPIIAILFAYVLFFRGVSVYALAKINYQRR